MGRKRKSKGGAPRPAWRGWGWLRTPAVVVLLMVPALVVVRMTLLGFGTADLGGHLLLDLLVAAVFFPLFSNRVMAETWEPLYFRVALLLLALYMGWLYLPSGFGLALFLFVLTLAAGAVLRLVRLHLWQVTFVRGDPFLDPLGSGPKDTPENPMGARDAGTWGAKTSWTRFVALPVILGLLLSYVAIRVARPMDKRAAAEPVLEANRPSAIAKAFLKGATNGNAPLFAREHAIWYVAPDARRRVMGQAASLFSSFKRETNRLGLQWADLEGAKTAGVTGADPLEQTPDRIVYAFGRDVRGWLDDPEEVPSGARPVGRPGYGEVLVWVTPIRIELAKQPDGGWRVTSVGASVTLAFERPAGE